MQLIIDHFENIDPIMAKVVTAAFADTEPIRLRKPLPPELYFQELAEAVINQQLSTKAADTIWRRFKELAGEVTPERIAELDVEQMRATGVSRQKAGYLQAMAQAIIADEVNLAGIPDMDNAAVITELTKLKGIGPWTAEMFLMFALGRPDVFSYLDLGLMRAFELVYEKQVSRVLTWNR